MMVNSALRSANNSCHLRHDKGEKQIGMKIRSEQRYFKPFRVWEGKWVDELIAVLVFMKKHLVLWNAVYACACDIRLTYGRGRCPLSTTDDLFVLFCPGSVSLGRQNRIRRVAVS